MTRNHSAFHVGDRVRVEFGRRKLTGVIVEDRGALGAHGKRLYEVDFPMDPFEPMKVALQEDEMEAIPPGTESSPTMDKQKIIAYLVNGGLITILWANLSGGKNQPRVWLCPDQLGNVTHTFVPERGLVGGKIVPVLAVHDNKVFTPKQAAVLSLVESFGLNHQEAEKVIAEVGTAP